MDGVLATTARELDEIVERVRAAGSLAFDLEFVPEGRYIPELALVQVAWGDPDEPELAAIDPLEVDVAPFAKLVADEEIETIAHAAQADLAILAGSYETQGRAVIDTQIAAAFAGYGDQIGYAALVQSTLGVRLHKGSQYTEWLRRPLSRKQLAYALDDVRYLGRVWGELRTRLDGERLAWAIEECERLAATAWRRPTPGESYRRVKGWSRLNARERGALRELAAWREREALRANRPPSRVLNDRSMLELARTGATSEEGLRAVRGVDEGVVRRHGSRLLDVIEQGAANPPEREPSRAPLSPAGEVWAAALHGLVRALALEAGVAPRFLGPRSEIEAVVRWWIEGDREAPPPLPLLDGWRGRLAGDAILAWLGGEAARVADPASEAGVRLEPRTQR
ncbi:MAG: ribonuclease D [Chloroflexi bacterium]|nr:ribonuclease D [Chloroflexota bacterium]